MLRPKSLTRLQPPSCARRVTGQSLRNYVNRPYLKIQNLNVCRVCMFPTHKLSHSAEAILRDTSHVLQPSVRHQFEHIITGRYDEFEEGLWLMFTSNTMPGKKIVRSWARRRVVHAVTQELRMRGFDSRGRRVETDSTAEDQQPGSAGKRPDLLVGTVDIEAMEHGVHLKFAEVQEQAAHVVERILKICGRRARKTGPTVNWKPSG